MRTRGSGRGWRGGAGDLRVVMVALTAAFAAGVALRRGDPAQVPLLDAVVYPGVYGAAGLLLLRQRPANRWERMAWRALGAAMLINAIGSVYYSVVLAPDPDPPFPSVADALFLGWYPLSYAGVLLLLRARVSRWYPSMWLDGLVSGLGAAALGAAVLFSSLMRVDDASIPELVVNLAYPVGDVLLMLVLIGGAAVLGAGFGRTLYLVTVGLALTCAADITYLVQEAHDTYAEGGPLDVVWLLGVCVLGFAASPTSPGVGCDRAPAGDAIRVSWRVLALPAVFTACSLVVLAAGSTGRVPGSAVWLAAAAIMVGLARWVLTFREVRDLNDMHRQSRTDDLTGLANRRALYEGCQAALAASTPASPLSMLLLDLDRFKEVNDTLGHEVGDELLQLIAGRLAASLPRRSTLARLGGDEFGVLLPATDSTQAAAAAERLMRALDAPFQLYGITLHVDASIGVATASDHTSTRGELLRCADVAMYDAKVRRVGVAVFGADSDGDSLDRLSLLQDLRQALAADPADPRRQVIVHFQPQIRLSPGGPGGLVVGAEALVRWQHPTRGLLFPDTFLPLIEAAGLHGRLAELVLDAALTECAQWWTVGHDIPVSVNLSAANLQDLDLPTKITATLARHQLTAHALVVELTEDMLMLDPQAARHNLAHIRQLGVAVSIDDYGTGYSSLAYLHDLSVDELKLDRTFIRDVTTNPGSASIVRHTVGLAHALGLRLVAEGIETPAAAETVSALGCDIGQGYHIARPMPPSSMLTWLHEHDHPHQRPARTVRSHAPADPADDPELAPARHPVGAPAAL